MVRENYVTKAKPWVVQCQIKKNTQDLMNGNELFARFREGSITHHGPVLSLLFS